MSKVSFSLDFPEGVGTYRRVVAGIRAIADHIERQTLDDPDALVRDYSEQYTKEDDGWKFECSDNDRVQFVRDEMDANS